VFSGPQLGVLTAVESRGKGVGSGKEAVNILI